MTSLPNGNRPKTWREDGYLPASRLAPIIDAKDHGAPSIFRASNMLRASRRLKGLADGRVPRICVLDPDGDIVRYLRVRGEVLQSPHWACFHTRMWERSTSAGRIGFIGCAVGGSFAVLIAEQLFASGCEVLVSIASAGQIADTEMPSQTILIDRALRDEGTSYHYLPPAPFVSVEESLAQLAERAFAGTGQPVLRGTTWTTDAPFRETSEAIAARRSEGVLAVEMEAASLYAFGAACGYPVLCLAQVTNQLGCIEGDFEKGEHDGASGSLALIDAFAAAWRAQHSSDALAALRSKRS